MPKYVVRYGAMRFLGIMTTRGEETFSRGTQVIARTDRGLECSIVLCEATEESTKELKNPTQGQIRRAMTSGDGLECSRLLAQQLDEFKRCRELVGKSGLQMELVDLEHVFGGERIVVYYLAENRIDFRDLVKQLAS